MKLQSLNNQLFQKLERSNLALVKGGKGNVLTTCVITGSTKTGQTKLDSPEEDGPLPG